MGTRMGLRTMYTVLDERRNLRFSGEITQERAQEIDRKVNDASAALSHNLDLFRPVAPVLDAWRAANPNARAPRWYKNLEHFAAADPRRAYVAIALFTQQAEGITTTALLNRAAESACRMAACSHPRGEWSGTVHASYGEYDDNLIFICPDCGYKGS